MRTAPDLNTLKQQAIDFSQGYVRLVEAISSDEVQHKIIAHFKPVPEDEAPHERQGSTLPGGIRAEWVGPCFSLCASWNGAKHCLRYTLEDGFEWGDCP